MPYGAARHCFLWFVKLVATAQGVPSHAVPCDIVSPGAVMSQFSTMTTNERKMQAAAVCREIQGPEGMVRHVASLSLSLPAASLH